MISPVLWQSISEQNNSFLATYHLLLADSKNMHYFLQQLHYLDRKSISDKKNSFWTEQYSQFCWQEINVILDSIFAYNVVGHSNTEPLT